MRKLIAAILGIGVLVVALAQGRLFKRYVVEGRSMLRAYAPGDRLVAEAVSYRFRSPRVGEVVVLRPPSSEGRLDLKRIAAGPGAEVTVQDAPDFLGKNEWYVLGDNLDESTDSRELGPIKTNEIVGRVWFKY